MPVPEFLTQAAGCPPGSYAAMPAHELTDRCGFRVRNRDEVAAIREMLAGAGLRTDPDFADADRDAIVRLVPVEHEAEQAPPPTEETEQDRFELPQVAPKVANLASAHRELVYVRPDVSVDYAMGLLFKQGLRQLPILSAPTVCHGMVTWESIAQFSFGKSDTRVLDCKVDHETATVDQDLFSVLPRVTAARCAFVQDESGAYCGVITARDVVTYLGNILEPFYVIGEIERRIRRHLNDRFTEDDRARFGHPDRFVFGKYHDVLCTADRFARLGWPTNRDLFLDALDRVRKVRNSVMHFNGEGLPKPDIDALHNFRNWIAALSAGG